MAKRNLPGLGLTGFWGLGANGWGDENDENLRQLSALTQLSVISATTNLPGGAADGDIYIVPTGQTNAAKIAIRDAGAWVYLTPKEGWLGYIRDADKYVSYTGSAWSDLVAGGGGGSGGIEEAPADGKLYGRINGGWDEIPDTMVSPVLSGFFGGKTTASEELFRFIAPTTLTFPDENCRVKAGVAATAITTLTLQKNGVNAGTISFAAGSASGTPSWSTDISLAADDALTINAPATPDATLANIAVTFLGV